MAPTRWGAAFISSFLVGKSTMHGPIASGLYTTLINLSPTAYREKTKKEKKREKEALKLLSLLFLGTVRRTTRN
jgi:hypothetical protein